MRAVQVESAGGSFDCVDRERPAPGDGEVRLEVEACGVCHSDSYVKEGNWDGITYPRIPGHEIVGRVDAVGSDVETWEPGTRAGVGWHGSHCFTCDPCRRGRFINCRHEQITGIDRDGGYAEYVVASAEALARVPEELDSTAAAPLLCAGVSTYRSLQLADTRDGDVVGIQGIGGLGHLGIQFASAAGFETVAISRGTEKRELAHALGADHYVDARSRDPGDELANLGGASVVLATAPNSRAIQSVVSGLGVGGELITLGVPDESVDVDVLELIDNQRSITGWSSGTAADSEDALAFSALHDVAPKVERYPLEEADVAYDRMKSGDARFRVVLEP
ncbi:alcohol dehydrogenase [Natrarchaeobius halalkaliphilus]|uniref:Alcohol dehydrogenase n=1 Tax=Natrarchaeobius halalkaliphilus TaxID=1679091 RepID=A0A3N6NVH1_9EURY|nr:alcohol dehydrogenase catalytic domain-containing protein [Natrarchaeobius halalkaliphilus]RQG87832.1 alcohol dehydrogenase [Natrarchaeobius halalkaliphilus]